MDANDTDASQTKGIKTSHIRKGAVTSAKLADDISIAGSLTVPKTVGTAIGGIYFGSKNSNERITCTTNTLRIASDSGIRIGTLAELDTSGSTKIVSCGSAGAITCNGITSYSTISSQGDIIAYSSSDAALKDNIKNIQNPLSKISKLNGVSFTWNNNQKTYSGYDIGVIAQEVQDVFPEIVTTREDGYKAVRYEKLIPLLIECIKELNAKLDALK